MKRLVACLTPILFSACNHSIPAAIPSYTPLPPELVARCEQPALVEGGDMGIALLEARAAVLECDAARQGVVDIYRAAFPEQ